MMDNTIGVDTVYSVRPRRSTRTPSIVPYTLRKIKKVKGDTIERQKNPKKSNRNVKNRDAPT